MTLRRNTPTQSCSAANITTLYEQLSSKSSNSTLQSKRTNRSRTIYEALQPHSRAEPRSTVDTHVHSSSRHQHRRSEHPKTQQDNTSVTSTTAALKEPHAHHAVSASQRGTHRSNQDLQTSVKAPSKSAPNTKKSRKIEPHRPQGEGAKARVDQTAGEVSLWCGDQLGSNSLIRKDYFHGRTSIKSDEAE